MGLVAVFEMDEGARNEDALGLEGIYLDVKVKKTKQSPKLKAKLHSPHTRSWTICRYRCTELVASTPIKLQKSKKLTTKSQTLSQ